MDFRLHHYGAAASSIWDSPVYGLSSGGLADALCYPPLFLLLFAPLAALPIDRRRRFGRWRRSCRLFVVAGDLTAG